MKETVWIDFNGQKVFLGAKKHVFVVSVKFESFWSFLKLVFAKSGSNLDQSRRSLKHFHNFKELLFLRFDRAEVVVILLR